ncbi:MAG: type IIL restriction-modification enzyme MmeI [Planctomycetaceae bacterium]
MNTTETTTPNAGFIPRWQTSAAAERANYQLFLSELCHTLGVGKPDPSRDHVADNAYVFERDVTFHNPDGTTSTGRIDLYKRGCFVLEAKQGSEQLTAIEREDAGLVGVKKKKRGTAVRGTKGWDDAMVKAKCQAEQYARALPAEEGWPPFLVVVDVGHTIELYSEFTRSGKTYLPFPDPGTYRIRIDQLANEKSIRPDDGWLIDRYDRGQ